MQTLTYELNQTLQEWLNKYGFDNITPVASSKFGFSYWETDETVGYWFVLPKEAIKSWDDFLEELGCNYIIDPFYSSFLHELAHDRTLHLLTDEEFAATNTKLVELAQRKNSYEKDMIYYHLPREIIASEWAVNYINTYPERIAELVNMTQPVMRKILNLIESKGENYVY